MPKFAANLTLLFTEVPLLDRFNAARAAGFNAVEILYPYSSDADELSAKLKESGLTQVLINSPPGDWENGERGISALPGRETEFRDSLDQTMVYAKALNTKIVHIMAGIVANGLSDTKVVDTFITNLSYAAETFGKAGINVTIEPLNTRNVNGYLLSRQSEARDIIERVGHPNLGLQFDFFHVQITEGDLITKLEEFLPNISHIQIAGVPSRHEPDIGEINYPYIFKHLDKLGYTGYVGCEYNPATFTEAGLGWFRSASNNQ